MAVIAGIDGCQGGWLCISMGLSDRKIESRFHTNAQELIFQEPKPLIMAIDIPIGLTDSGQRQCDKLARQLLGEPRRRSVFPAPIRPALKATTRKEADAITRSVDGRGVGAQAWGLYEKIRDIDSVLGESPELQNIIREIHPELSFMAWNGGAAIAAAKKTPVGQAARSYLIRSHFGEDAFSIINKNQNRLPKTVKDDDIHDAFAALWTAERIYRWRATVIPYPPETDSVGLRMEMWF